jgi:hypothetical protein
MDPINVASTEPVVIPNNYIVVFKEDTPHDKCDAHCAWASEIHSQKVYTDAEDVEKYHGIKHRYKLANGWSGYSGSFDDDMIKELEDTDEVSCEMSSPFWGVVVMVMLILVRACRSTTSSRISRSTLRISSRTPLVRGAKLGSRIGASLRTRLRPSSPTIALLVRE